MTGWQDSRMANGRMAEWRGGRMAGWQDARWQDGIKGRIVVLYSRREGTGTAQCRFMIHYMVCRMVAMWCEKARPSPWSAEPQAIPGQPLPGGKRYRMAPIKTA
jgi:hypothetical protein